MGPPGGGRNTVTPRYLRHYNVLAVLDFDDGSLSTIFNTILDWWIRKAHLPHEVRLIYRLYATKVDFSWEKYGPHRCNRSKYSLSDLFQITELFLCIQDT
jgi:hypothetical protein